LVWRFEAGLDVHAEGRYYVHAVARCNVRACVRACVRVRACMCACRYYVRERAHCVCSARAAVRIPTGTLSTMALAQRLACRCWSTHTTAAGLAALRDCEHARNVTVGLCGVTSAKRAHLIVAGAGQTKRENTGSAADSASVLRKLQRATYACNMRNIHATGNVQDATDIRHKARASNMQRATCSV
jgi:hypothetical protein